MTVAHQPGDIAETYLAVWNEADDARRRALLEQSWAADARYADPLMQGQGRDGIAAMMGAARAQFPGHNCTLHGIPDRHGNHVRFSWIFAPRGARRWAAALTWYASMPKAAFSTWLASLRRRLRGSRKGLNRASLAVRPAFTGSPVQIGGWRKRRCRP